MVAIETTQTTESGGMTVVNDHNRIEEEGMFDILMFDILMFDASVLR
jgi:hypothetical protein